MSSLPITNEFLWKLIVLSVLRQCRRGGILVLRQLAPECVQTREIAPESEHCLLLMSFHLMLLFHT